MPYKKHILASLLIAFSFIVMHDFVIVTVDSNAQHETCLHKLNQASPDTTLSVHEIIHQSMWIASHLPAGLTKIGKSSETFEEISLFISDSSLTLDRPPTT